MISARKVFRASRVENVQKSMSKRMAWASEKAFGWFQESRNALLACCFRAPKRMSVFPNSLKPNIEMHGCRIIVDFRNQAASRRSQIVRRRNNHSLDIVRFYQHLPCWRFRSAALRWNQRQKNFSFDMTPLAGFSRKTTRNRLHTAARFLSKSMVFIQKRSRRLPHRSIRPGQFGREKRRCAQD